MGKTFVMGDIHGRQEAFLQCIERSKFNSQEDTLILLGDIVDGGFNTYAVVEELLKIPKLIYIFGNHDVWFMNHIKSGWAKEIWMQQGGANTLRSYGAEVEEAEHINDKSKIITTNLNIPVTHQDFFNKGVYWHKQEGMIFVHGGFNPKIPKMTSQSQQELVWNRSLINFAQRKLVPGYEKVFVGHTTTQSMGIMAHINNCMEPIWFNNLCMMDCGAGWNGKLAIMDINTNEYWLSDKQDPARSPIRTKLIESMFNR